MDIVFASTRAASATAIIRNTFSSDLLFDIMVRLNMGRKGRYWLIPQSKCLLATGVGRSGKKGIFTGRVRNIAHMELGQVGAAGQSVIK